MVAYSERITENMEDFFRELEDSLRGEVPEAEIRDSLNYYYQYFKEQKEMGYSENEIISSLGSPRLIARSIIDAKGAVNGQGSSYDDQNGNYDNGRYNGNQDGYYDVKQERYNDYEDRAHLNVKKVSGFKLVLGVILILIILGLLIRVLLPVVIVLIPVLIVLRLFRGGW